MSKVIDRTKKFIKDNALPIMAVGTVTTIVVTAIVVEKFTRQINADVERSFEDFLASKDLGEEYIDFVIQYFA